MYFKIRRSPPLFSVSLIPFLPFRLLASWFDALSSCTILYTGFEAHFSTTSALLTPIGVASQKVVSNYIDLLTTGLILASRSVRCRAMKHRLGVSSSATLFTSDNFLSKYLSSSGFGVILCNTVESGECFFDAFLFHLMLGANNWVLIYGF